MRRPEKRTNEAALHGSWLTEKKVKRKFTEQDLRAQRASDATSLEHARALLSHADSKTKRAIYRRKPEVVNPLNGVD